ncbi:MAG: hypothetical protein ACR2P5_08310 [Gammaproteobacteria bacterium]
MPFNPHRGNPIYDYFAGHKFGDYDEAYKKRCWDWVLYGAIADQHKVLKAAGMLPREWEERVQKKLAEIERGE